MKKLIAIFTFTVFGVIFIYFCFKPKSSYYLEIGSGNHVNENQLSLNNYYNLTKNHKYKNFKLSNFSTELIKNDKLKEDILKTQAIIININKESIITDIIEDDIILELKTIVKTINKIRPQPIFFILNADTNNNSSKVSKVQNAIIKTCLINKCFLLQAKDNPTIVIVDNIKQHYI